MKLEITDEAVEASAKSLYETTNQPWEGLTVKVECGDGAAMRIVDPRSFTNGGVEWRLRYGDPNSVRYIAASLIENYDFLLSNNITRKEAARRLGLLRKARAALADNNDEETQ